MQTQVVIGIQARSGSTRLPRKAYEVIGRRRMLDHVIIACNRAAGKSSQLGHSVNVAVVTPVGDSIANDFRDVEVIQGAEHDVLARYGLLLEKEPDYIVRVTGDCPLIPPFIISRHIDLAVKHRYDYVANVDDRWRLAIDGIDCEVFSADLLKWALMAARDPYDREHVTPIMRREPPHWAKIGAVISAFDMSSVKYSVDTPHDLQRARDVYESSEKKSRAAIVTLGATHVHRI